MGGEISTAVGPETWTGTAARLQAALSSLETASKVLPFLIDAARKGATWAGGQEVSKSLNV